MTATNQQMTSEQLDELMVVAVSMQRDAEKLDERPVAVFAYAVQLALAELQNARKKLAAVVAENAGLKSAITTHSQSTHFCEVCGKDDPCSTDDVCYALSETPATDAAIAKIQAQGVEALAAKYESEIEPYKNHDEFMNAHYLSVQANAARKFAAQLRQGAEQ